MYLTSSGSPFCAGISVFLESGLLFLMTAMKRKVLCCGVSLLVIALGSGCQMAELLRENTEGIKTTSQAIATNTTAMAATTQTMQSLESTLQQESSLKKPMQDLAALGPTFNRVADLDRPMKEVAGLRDPMVQLSALKVSLDQVAKLDKPHVGRGPAGRVSMVSPPQGGGAAQPARVGPHPSYSRAVRRSGDSHHWWFLCATISNDMGSGPTGSAASFCLRWRF